MPDAVDKAFSSYPDQPRQRLLRLRALVEAIAQDESLGPVESSLKWGEASFSVKGGSPLRLDWKARSPESCYVYFHCQTKLVDTFRELYAGRLLFEGNRAIRLPLDQPLPEDILRHCFTLAMTYHRIKHLPLLGC